ncbi:nucleotidyltransferase family protein [Echinicola vietnamensis]|uniref:Putative sugar nucleotidyltransferase n=1 Tax=Echinicola vietnamensis (strain DSM 17526 / LMG 23754 / KMM 6221) TaxID=926556 RepID=L0G6F7_ECHVK|nr:NTP transferase domain-containing protein [Echinicola vietnamensis]AGA80571.1 putative sugar nucleotidyltransferase [Echinicola vietnamensis DSM 17526]
MQTTKPALLILAAGMGSRYGGNKQIDGFGPNNETILEYAIYDAIQAGFGKVVFVVRAEILDLVKDRFLDKINDLIQVEFVIQSLTSLVPAAYQNPERTKPYGTAHAVLCAKEVIEEPFAVINADDFYGKEAIDRLGKFLTHPQGDHQHCMVGYALKNVLSQHGTVNRGVCDANDKGELTGMTEREKISREGEKVISRMGEDVLEISENTPVSMNCWGFQPSFFAETEKRWKVFLEENKDNSKAEFYIPTVVNDLIAESKASVRILEGGKTWFGVTYPEDKVTVEEALNFMHQKGVYPGKLWEPKKVRM